MANSISYEIVTAKRSAANGVVTIDNNMKFPIINHSSKLTRLNQINNEINCLYIEISKKTLISYIVGT